MKPSWYGWKYDLLYNKLKSHIPFWLSTGSSAVLWRLMSGSAFGVCQSDDPQNEKGW